MILSLRCLLFFSLFAGINFHSTCFANDEQQEIQNFLLEDLQTMKYYFNNKYAPIEWKKEHLGWDLEQEYTKAQNAILNKKLTTVKDYQKILKSFLYSAQDYHVNICFYATELAFFPISIKGVNERYYVTSVNRHLQIKPSEELFKIDSINLEPFQSVVKKIKIGDELLALNGIPIKEVIEQIIEDNFKGNYSNTGYNLAEKTVFFRRARMGVEVPTGMFELTLFSAKRKKNYKVQLPWLHVSEWIKNQELNNLIQMNADQTTYATLSTPTFSLERFLAKDFSVPHLTDLLKQPDIFVLASDSTESIPTKKKQQAVDQRMKGFLPPLGKIIWQTPESYKIYAYLYQNSSDQKIGYVYLPSFSFEGQYETLMKELVEVFRKFDQESVALVFDTNNNTGGNLLFMYAVLSLLTDKPLSVPTHREIIVQQDVLQSSMAYLELCTLSPKDKKGSLSGYPFNAHTIESIKAYSLEIVNTWKAGKRLTDPLFLVGIDQIDPHPLVYYTKPLVVLINELNLSCGDFFPAILQDNHRALLFGNKTGGAGGHVKPYAYLSRLGVESFSLTASIARRTTGDPIENLGVSPHIFYTPTKKDVCSRYEDYISAVNHEVKKLIK